MRGILSLIVLLSLYKLGISSKSLCPGGEVPFQSTDADGHVLCQNFEALTVEATQWLRHRLPTWDRENEMSLFGEPAGADGLDTGLVTVGLNSTLHAKIKYPWAAKVPKDIFLDYVVPYANVNEARNNWRPYIEAAIEPLVADLMVSEVATVADVFHALNGDTPAGYASSIWTSLGNYATGGQIVFNPGTTPLIYDPMTLMVYGGASCTGVSILMVDALRSVGVAARVVGTPAWNAEKANGNHNWLEVYFPEDGTWHFSNGAIAGAGPAGEVFENPCDKWFCHASYMANGTQVFAAHFDNKVPPGETFVHFPMAWDLQNKQIPGIDRTEYYQKVCGQC